jgi:hypothetical protein
MIAMASNTALLFDSQQETARLVLFDGELDTLRELLGVDSVDTIRVDKQHVMFVDDEGFLKQLKTGFRIKHGKRAIEFAGNGLLTGDMYGANAPITLNVADLDIEVLKFEYERE